MNVESQGDQPGSSSVTLREVSLQVTGHSLQRTRRAQRAFVSTAVYRASRWLTLGISNFPSWSQSAWCRQQLHNSSTTQNVQFCSGCDSRQQEFQVRSGSAWSAQLSALVQRQGKCQVVPIRCTPANYSCSASNNTVLTGSGIARCVCGGVLHHHKCPWKQFSQPKTHSEQHSIKILSPTLARLVNY